MAAPCGWRGGGAGSRFENMCVRMNLLPTLDAYVAIRPSAGLSVSICWAVGLQSFGRKEHVREAETQNITWLIEMLQATPPARASLTVAANKRQVVLYLRTQKSPRKYAAICETGA